MTSGLVIIVIPCYNQARFLGEAIESALTQTYRDSEIIVVDDGSTDTTAEVAGRYANLRLLQQSNQGLAAARNRGLAEARGEYVVFLDADDRLLPDALEAGLRCLALQPKAAFAYGHVKLIASDGSPLPTPSQPDVERDHYLQLLRNNFIWTPGAVIYRRSVFDTVGNFNPRVNASADFDLNVRIAREFPIRCCGKPVLEYRIHGQNMTRNYEVMLRAAVSARRAHLPYVADNNIQLRAWREGLQEIRRGYGDPLASQVHDQWRSGEWSAATRGVVTLLSYHPRGAIKAFLPAGAIACLQRLRAKLLALTGSRRLQAQSGASAKGGRC